MVEWLSRSALLLYADEDCTEDLQVQILLQRWGWAGTELVRTILKACEYDVDLAQAWLSDMHMDAAGVCLQTEGQVVPCGPGFEAVHFFALGLADSQMRKRCDHTLSHIPVILGFWRLMRYCCRCR